MIFAGCALISIVIWVCNWVCWIRQCCCFSAFDEYSNKIFVWWLCFIFFSGVIACCIAGFVTANRYGFCTYAVQCAYERIYYDAKNGKQCECNLRILKHCAHIKKYSGILSINVINEQLLFPIITFYGMIWRVYESHYFNKNLKLKCKKFFFTILIICASLLSFFLSKYRSPASR
jgi:hypothetical protein